MKVEVTALRDFPFAEDGEAIRRVKKDEVVRVNLTTARAWAEAGKVNFEEPKAATPQDDDKA